MCNQLPNLFSELLEAATSTVQRGLGFSEFGDSRAAVIELAMADLPAALERADIERQPRAEFGIGSALGEVMRELRAVGAMLAINDPRRPEPEIAFLYGQGPTEDRWRLELAARLFDFDSPDSTAAGAVQWADFRVRESGYCAARQTVQAASGVKATMTAYFQSLNGAKRRAVEHAFRIVAPLLASLVSASQLGKEVEQRFDAMASAIDSVDHGIVLLDRTGNIILSNRIASRMLDKEDGVRRAGQSIISSDLADAGRFRTAIDYVLPFEVRQFSRRKPDGAAPLVSLRRGDKKRPLLAMFARTEGSLGNEHCAIHLFDSGRDLSATVRAVCKTFHLSKVESELACQLASGTSLAEAAATLHIKEQTARGYLKQIFVKSDTHRQVDLVRLLLTSISINGTEIEVV